MLNITVIAGTIRPKRQSIKAAHYVAEIGRSLPDVKITFVDPVDFNLPYDGNDDESKDPRYTKIVEESDAFFIVTPEYNHSYPGSLKKLLDSELKNYTHKAVALAGVSDGNWGGTRVVESLLHPLRAMGLVVIWRDVFFPYVDKLFDEDGKINDESFKERILKSYDELIWMAKVLKYGRENM